jgi:tetratricopeptide (TPR) repeat protein
VGQWMAAAHARRELDRIAGAREAWERAIELDRETAEAHEGLARLLEGEEMYAEALKELDWLTSRRPADPDLKVRGLAARHGAKLQRQIGK